jgi:hypothetical protein
LVLIFVDGTKPYLLAETVGKGVFRSDDAKTIPCFPTAAAIKGGREATYVAIRGE